MVLVKNYFVKLIFVRGLVLFQYKKNIANKDSIEWSIF